MENKEQQPYRVVHADSTESLSRKVARYFKKGYEAQGGISLVNSGNKILMAQALIKKREAVV